MASANTFGTTQPATTPTATAQTPPTQSSQMPVQGPQIYMGTPATAPTTSQANSATPISPTASTTTLSNGNKINQVPAIQSTTNNLSNNGITTDQNGNANYANGTSANAAVNPQPTTPLVPTNNLGTPGISQGGYVGDSYYAPGSVLPTDGAGQPMPTQPTSPTDDLIMNNLQKQLAQSDAMTATVLQGIQSSYSSLIQQQQQANSIQQNQTQNALLMGGVTGSGSSAQFAPISSAGVIAAQVNYGLNQVAQIQSKENDAIIAAKKAGQDEDFQLQDKINTQISNIRDTKVAAAQKVQDQIQTANQKLADEKLQQTKDSFVASELKNGITDPNQILQDAENKGLTMTAEEVGTSMTALSPDKKEIESLAAQAAAAGASPDVVAKITSAGNFNDALTLATPALGAKAANDLVQQKFDNSIKQQEANNSSAQVAIAQENANINLAKLQQDKTNAAQSALNALVTTPSGKKYIDGTDLDAAGKAAALNAGQTVLSGDSAKSMTAITNVQGQLNSLLSAFQSSGVDLSKGGMMGNTGGTLGAFTYHAAGGATPALKTFGTNITSMVKDLQSLPGTGDLVSTLQANIPKDGDSAFIMNNKITNIASSLENAENLLLSNGGEPQEGATGQIQVNGKSVTATFHNGAWSY